MNDVKRHSRNLRSDNSKFFNIDSLSADDEVREIRVKREFEKRLESFENNYRENDESDEKMEKVELFVRDDYLRERSKPRRSLFKILLNFKSLFIGLLLSLICLYFVFTYVLNSVVLEILPKSFSSAVNSEIVLSNTVSPESYEFVELNKEIVSKLGALEERKVSAKATGTIRIYNNYSEASQKLVKNTRFETKEGQVFRITDSVIVPGMSRGKSGMVEAKVIADFVGSEYNITPTKFGIPGFKGSVRYDSFFAESSSPMSGGSNSYKKVIDQSKINEIRTKSEIEIANLVNKDISKVSKTGYVLADKVLQINYTDNIDNIVNGKEDSYKLTGNVKVMIINEGALASAIASKINNSYLGEKVSFVDYDNAKMNIEFASTSNVILSNSSMLLKVSSPNVNFIYDIDSDKISNAIAGKKSDKENFSKLMADFPQIQKAKPSLVPFWSSTFPSSLSKIEIIKISE